MQRRSRTRLVVAVAVLALVAATLNAGSASAGAPSRKAKKLGSPATIAFFSGDSPNFKFTEDEKAMDLAIKKINKSGGWNGHEVRKSVCASGETANQAIACARQFVDDPTVVAVWEFTGYFSAVEPILNAAGLPIIASATNTPGEFSCNLCYPIQPGYVGTGGSTPLLASQVLKAKSVYYVVLDVPNGIGFPVFAQSFVAANNLTLENKGVIPIPFTATDLTAQVVKAGSGADAIIITTIETQVVAFLQTAEQQGVKAPIITLMSALPLKDVKQLGAAADGVYLTSAYNYDSARRGEAAEVPRQAELRDRSLLREQRSGLCVRHAVCGEGCPRRSEVRGQDDDRERDEDIEVHGLPGPVPRDRLLEVLHGIQQPGSSHVQPEPVLVQGRPWQVQGHPAEGAPAPAQRLSSVLVGCSCR